MKILVAMQIFILQINSITTHNEDILVKKRNLIIYADGIAQELINERKPIINSWRKDMLEVRNMCKIVECNYLYIFSTNFPNRFKSNKCYIENNYYCENDQEEHAVFKLEQIIHESDYSTSITLGGETFGIIANSKSEDAIIFERGDKLYIIAQDEVEKDRQKKDGKALKNVINKY